MTLGIYADAPHRCCTLPGRPDADLSKNRYMAASPIPRSGSLRNEATKSFAINSNLTAPLRCARNSFVGDLLTVTEEELDAQSLPTGFTGELLYRIL